MFFYGEERWGERNKIEFILTCFINVVIFGVFVLFGFVWVFGEGRDSRDMFSSF